MREVTHAINNGATSIYIALSSFGGKVHYGLRAAGMLKSLQPRITVTTHNLNHCHSAANLIFAAGSIRYATKAATFLFHEISCRVTSDRGLKANELFDLCGETKDLNDRYAGTYAAYTGRSKDFVWNLMENEITLNTTEALNHSIVHEIRDFDALPLGGLIIIEDRRTVGTSEYMKEKDIRTKS